jgi:peptide/nickel transport system ATP-binding protein
MKSKSQDRPILTIDSLSVRFSDDIIPLRDIHLELYAGESLVLLGESGAGKSLLCKTLFGYQQISSAMRVSGTISGTPTCAMIFQDPSQFLHPRVSIKRHFFEFLRLQQPEISKNQALNTMVELLLQVELPATTEFLARKTGELSGGQQQRVMIALALSQKPQLLIADEPVTALDTRTKQRILELLQKLQQELGLSILFVTHDLSAAKQIAHKIVVLYAGRILEVSNVQDFFNQPHHPYSRALIDAHPGPEHHNQPLFEIPGSMPLPNESSTGCVFAPRCGYSKGVCSQLKPILELTNQANLVACHMVTNKDLWERADDRT